MFEKILSLETYKDNNVKKNMRVFLTGDPTLSTFSEQLLLLGNGKWKEDSEIFAI